MNQVEHNNFIFLITDVFKNNFNYSLKNIPTNQHSKKVSKLS